VHASSRTNRGRRVAQWGVRWQTCRSGPVPVSARVGWCRYVATSLPTNCPQNPRSQRWSAGPDAVGRETGRDRREAPLRRPLPRPYRGQRLFLLGLLTGLAVPLLKNPRMGVASHLQGMTNGPFLMVVGLMWSRVTLPQVLQVVTVALLTYGAYANWLATQLGSLWGAGHTGAPRTPATSWPKDSATTRPSWPARRTLNTRPRPPRPATPQRPPDGCLGRPRCHCQTSGGAG
jgi:hypothetical protein